MPIGVVTISTDEGVDGDVFLSPPGVDVASQLVSLAKPMLLGRDPLDIGAIWHDFAARSRMFDATVQGYIDIALWDCAGFHILLPAHGSSAPDGTAQSRLRVGGCVRCRQDGSRWPPARSGSGTERPTHRTSATVTDQ